MNFLNKQELPLLGVIDKPRFLPAEEINRCQSYRDAVCLCWQARRIHGMTRATLAERSGCNPSHVGDYIDPEERTRKGAARRNLPLVHVPGFESACGNYAITQWHMRRSGLHIAEELMRAA